MSIDPRFERVVLAEFRFRERRARRRAASYGARLLAQELHHDQHDLLDHLRRVAVTLPSKFRAVAWLHHASGAGVTRRALRTAGLTTDEAAAVELFDTPPALRSSVLHRARSLSSAPGRAGQLARVVARVAMEDRLDGAQPRGDTLTALRLLPEPGFAA